LEENEDPTDSVDIETDGHSQHGDSSDDDFDSADSDSDDDGQCIAKFRTYCSRSIVGTRSEGCDDLQMISYVDGAGNECDQTLLHGNSYGDGDSDEGTLYNAMAGGGSRSAPTSPIEWIKELDPFTKWTLLAILVTALALMAVACYVCVYLNSARGNRQCHDRIAEKAPSPQPGRVRRQSRERIQRESVRMRVNMKRSNKRERVRTISYDNVPMELNEEDFERDQDDNPDAEHPGYGADKRHHSYHAVHSNPANVDEEEAGPRGESERVTMHHLGTRHLGVLEEDEFNSDAHSALELTDTDVVAMGVIDTGMFETESER